MKEKLSGIEYLKSINSCLELEYQSFEIIKHPDWKAAFVFDSKIINVYLRTADQKDVRQKIGEVQFTQFDNSSCFNADYLHRLSLEGYFERLVERLYSREHKSWLILNLTEFDMLWCLDSIALLPEYRGHGLMKLILDAAKNKMIAKNTTNLIFGFSFPVQFWDAAQEDGDFYKVDNGFDLHASIAKLKQAYLDYGFKFIMHHETKILAEIEAVYFDRSRHSHLFYEIYKPK